MSYYQWELMEDFLNIRDEKESFEILWSPREFVREAHKLTIDKATKVFDPDEIWWDED